MKDFKLEKKPQSSKRNMRHSKHEISSLLSFFVRRFAFQDPGSGSATQVVEIDPVGSRSGINHSTILLLRNLLFCVHVKYGRSGS
jgi:hypothetical protein